jgi:hypothetical protein
MTTAVQLTIDGGEVPVSHGRGRVLGRNQREVLRRLALFSHMTSTQAGRVVHEMRGHCGFGARSTVGYAGLGCCEYASTDGSEVMRGLQERGLVEKEGGLWWLPRREWG